jgi:catechol 2,3-dioxygenase-like lactoylglutathione lyase family enzyme
MTTPIFDAVRCVAVPVNDLDRSKALFEQLGLTTSFDAELQPGFRWVELTAPSGGAALALVLAGRELPAGIDTGIRLVTSDARLAHDAVRRAGLDAGDLLDWPTAPLMFSFSDLDGNRFYVSEADANA